MHSRRSLRMLMAAACLAALLGTATLSGCTAWKPFKSSRKPVRYGSVIGVKPEMLDEYKRLHANPWPGVVRLLSEGHVQNYSIYLTQFPDGNYYLFSYMEYVGDDFEGDMARISAQEETKRWLKHTDPCQLPLANRKEGEWWKSMEEVFHMD